MGIQYRGAAALVLLAACCCRAQISSSPASEFHKLLHKSLDSGGDENLVFSPYSVSTALSMLRLATGGTSRLQIADVLGRSFRHTHLENVDQPGATLSVFNGLYYDSSLAVRERFVNLMQRQFDAVVEHKPFLSHPNTATDDVNREVELATHGKIRDLLPPADSTRVAVLLSAIYFRGEWKQAFDPELTRSADFYVSDRLVRQVPMMSTEGHYNFYQSPADVRHPYSAVAIPYKDPRFQMILVLPELGVNASDVVSDVIVDRLYKQMAFDLVALEFPRFRVEQKIDLTDTLKSLGISDVFSHSADLRQMSFDPRLYLSRVLHSAVIETDERGSEAAAATAGLLSARGAFSQVRGFLADRPFLFYLYDVTTSNVLFSGRVADPSGQLEPQLSPEDELLLQLLGVHGEQAPQARTAAAVPPARTVTRHVQTPLARTAAAADLPARTVSRHVQEYTPEERAGTARAHREDVRAELLRRKLALFGRPHSDQHPIVFNEQLRDQLLHI